MPNERDNSPATPDSSHAGTVSRRSVVTAGAGLAIGAAVPKLLSGTGAQAQVTNGTPRTLIIASHPYPDRSVVNRALWEPAQAADDTMFKNLESVYGDNLQGFDRTAERRLYQSMERLVLMFPIHWFNMTPMMKAYMNEVWGSGAPSELRGKELLVVTTTAGGPDAYRRDGRLGFTIEEVLTPLRASANYTSMIFSEPLAFLGAAGAGAEALRQYQDTLAARLREAPRKA
ncbi:Putative NADPH-quinone reductase (modulator of drug activity B) [Lutimaribacter pacificus]|uniref:NADPH-quinone reductase (Modulator of drug activity B) n=1 Tax=Lutimaribacter pacificus TaxID=391948 RepID=A0A1H0N6E3_9RHOB|nr:NAD(P)H-dependent oxidoreductase [Lutimaribacter pacificus]SDO88191.1 Putative NADPH-quinone reductase (modulator of drug activity B) [Lutimaribacter pacificus]SHK86686.1 Putative NADPH-quinone reductase (modulator of drug activity B) [Lutimaribacter pacificus]